MTDDRVIPLPRPGARRGSAKCPMCKRPVVAAHQPFCSPRCRDEDLRRWLVGDYRIPTDEPPPDGDPPAGGRE